MQTAEQYARYLVSTQPSPPRNVNRWLVWTASYSQRSSLILVVIGAVFSVGGGLVITYPGVHGNTSADTLFTLFVIGLGLLIVATPAVRAQRWVAAIERGEKGVAEVIKARVSRPGSSTTLDAVENGLATGEWLVHHSRGDFRARFEIDSPWAREVKSGTIVDVLVDPDKQTVMFQLGPH